MDRILLDANVVVSFLHRRVPHQQAQAAALFQEAAEHRLELVLHQHVLAETVHVLLNIYHFPALEVSAIAADFLALPNLERIDTLDDERLLSLWPRRIREFGDAIVAAVAMKEKLPVATFDRRLRNILTRLDVELWAW